MLTVSDDFSGGNRDSDFSVLCDTHGINVIDADLSKQSSFDLFATHYDDVYALASVVGVNRCIEEPDEVIRINTGIILNTAEWLRIAKPSRVLFASSSDNYAAIVVLLKNT